MMAAWFISQGEVTAALTFLYFFVLLLLLLMLLLLARLDY
jgi:hypothetical protein